MRLAMTISLSSSHRPSALDRPIVIVRADMEKKAVCSCLVHFLHIKYARAARDPEGPDASEARFAFRSKGVFCRSIFETLNRVANLELKFGRQPLECFIEL